MYRSYELELLKKLGSKVAIKEFSNGKWSYHAKGVWIEEADNSVLSIIGSSNFNERSRSRDSEFQFYIYSGCEDLNGRLKNEWSGLDKNCKEINI
jgi:phosphatidylserine/phosphatidylglycerophosphate/cardiolipin synthase-like enzyme